jgi:bifunctional DNase/RNase
MIIAVRVEKVTLDTSTNRFVVILRDDINKRWLPIVVGSAEAQAIALQLENIEPPRPLTHDLMKNLLDTTGKRVSRIIVNDLRENTYYAMISIAEDGHSKDVDARPSDAIALALRMQAPIFVDEEVMRKAAIRETDEEEAELEEKSPITELDELNTNLERAVQNERFEEAARLRDKIRELKKDIDKN